MRDLDPTRIDITVDPREQRMRGITRHGRMEFDVPFITQIEGNLWMGGCDDYLVLPTHIKHLVSLAPWWRYEIDHQMKSELYHTMYDSEDRPPTDELRGLVEHVNACVADAPTLVHCQAGLNRSSMLVTMALASAGGYSTADAIALLREKRSPAVLCNRTFENLLLEGDWR